MRLIESIKKKLRKKRESEKNIRDINEIIQYHVRKLTMDRMALSSDKPLVTQERQHSSPIVVSLTTYSVRIHSVHLVIESIAQQTIKPNKIVLWLDKNEFSIDTIPLILKKQMERGLEVKFCPNYKSYKKIYPTIKEYPDHDIITLDDDLIYPHDTIEQLVSTSRKNPYSIIGHRAHSIIIENRKFKPYKIWPKEINNNSEPYFNFITTGGGTLFPYVIAKIIFEDQELFTSICPTADDVWINLKSMQHNINRIKVNDPRDFKRRFIHIPDELGIGLNHYNVNNYCGNDIQINAVVTFLSDKINLG
ncbi:glycosyl transferase [Vibrio cholerae]